MASRQVRINSGSGHQTARRGLHAEHQRWWSSRRESYLGRAVAKIWLWRGCDVKEGGG